MIEKAHFGSNNRSVYKLQDRLRVCYELESAGDKIAGFAN